MRSAGRSVSHGADLSYADLSYTNLSYAILTGANLTNATLCARNWATRS